MKADLRVRSLRFGQDRSGRPMSEHVRPLHLPSTPQSIRASELAFHKDPLNVTLKFI